MIGGTRRRIARPLHLVIALSLIGVAIAQAPAVGHPADPQVRTVVDEVDPPMDGVTVRVEAGVATQLVVENPTDTEVVVLGRGGDPFLRIGPEGVLGNRNARDYYATATPTGGLPGPAEPGDGPDWQPLSPEPVWGWFDHRLHPEDISVPSDRDPTDGPVQFANWQVPMRYGDRDVIVSGHLEYAIAAGVVVTTITSDAEPLDGVTVAVSQGRVPAILLDNGTDDDVVVLGAAGEPFLRIGPDGVFGNRHSPSLAEDQRYRGEQLPGPVDAGAPPDWIRLASEPRYAWLETRARYPREQPPTEVVASGRPTRLLDWSVPIEQAGDQVVVTGETTWMTGDDALTTLGIPMDEGDDRGGVPWASWLALGVGAGLLGLGLNRRARQRSAAQGTSSSSSAG